MQIPKNIVALDFETYFSKDYYLKRNSSDKKGLSTSEYIRDNRFKEHLVGIRTGRERKPKYYGREAMRKKLASIDWSRSGLLCHNTAFDGLILSHHFGIVPAFYFDTLSMARAMLDNTIGNRLNEVAEHLGKGSKHEGVLEQTKGILDLTGELFHATGEYCVQDVALCEEIFREWRKDFPEDELRLIDMSIRAFADPVLKVDIPRAQADLKRTRAANRRMFRKCAHLLELDHLRGSQRDLAVKKVLNSDLQLADAMRSHGINVPMKTTKKGNAKPAFAQTDLEFKEMLISPDPNTKLLASARAMAKSNIAEKRAVKLLEHAEPALPIMINYCKAHTMRWSGGDDLNPQNFPSRGKGRFVKELRSSIIAPKGHKLVVVDSSQIEGRMLPWAAGDMEQLEKIANDVDMYNEIASKIYGRPIDRHKKSQLAEGMVGKTARLGLGYGMGAAKFQHTLAIGQFGPSVFLEFEQCKHAVATYRAENPKVCDRRNGFWAFMEKMLTVMVTGQEYNWRGICTFHPEGVDMPNGLTLWYPNLKAQQNPWNGAYGDFTYQAYKSDVHKHIYGGLFTENFIQCLARILVGEQLLELTDKYRLTMMSHDEGAFIVPTKQAERALEDMLEAFSKPSWWCPDIPVGGDGSIADNYGDAK